MLQKQGVLWGKTAFLLHFSGQYGPVRAKKGLILPCFVGMTPCFVGITPSDVGIHPSDVGMRTHYYRPPFPENLQTQNETHPSIIGTVQVSKPPKLVSLRSKLQEGKRQGRFNFKTVKKKRTQIAGIVLVTT
jgi:hypothetical protein